MSIFNQSPHNIYKNALALINAGDYGKAHALVKAACIKYPENIQMWLLHASINRNVRQYTESERCARHVLLIDQDNTDALIELALSRQYQGDNKEAIVILNNVIALDATSATAHYYLATINLESGNTVLAATHYQKVLDLIPTHIESLNNLSVIYTDQGNIHESISLIRRALSVSPNSYHMLINLARNYIFSGDSIKALAILRKVITLYPASPEARSKYLLCTNYIDSLSREYSLECHKMWHHMHGENIKRYNTYKCKLDPDRSLHVGYVSPDFRNHSVAFFIEPVLANHSKGRFIISCYSDVHNPDKVTRRISSSCDNWCYTYDLTDDQLAEKIHDDGVDILVDLAGHTANNRLMVFERKPAPLSISYLGYPNTTGLDCIDYRITDYLADSDDADSFYTEKLIRLPDGFLCYQPPEDMPNIRISRSPKSERMVFGSFNNLAKLTPDVIETWSRILNAVPGSFLAIKGKGSHDVYTRSRLISMLEARGIDSSRLLLFEYAKSTTEHLQMYNQVDIALDTFPYNGTTTTCEALLMGVPVITLRGVVHASRVGASILSRIGENWLIADGVEDYIKIALNLAADANLLGRYRRELRRTLLGSSLCDYKNQAMRIEDVYTTVWRDYIYNKTNTGGNI